MTSKYNKIITTNYCVRNGEVYWSLEPKNIMMRNKFNKATSTSMRELIEDYLIANQKRSGIVFLFEDGYVRVHDFVTHSTQSFEYENNN